MHYLQALHYSARRESLDDLRTQLADVEEVERGEMSAKRRRRLIRRIGYLHRRLAVAEDFAAFDWARGEAEFANQVAIETPGVFERFRSHGVPVRVLLDAKRKARRAG